MIAGKMQIPDGDEYFARMFARTGDRFQDELFQAALALTKNKRCAVDAGAHVGSWTRQMAAHFTEVLAFEPHPVNYACLKCNAQGSNVLRINVALGNSRGQCDMVKHGSNSGCWRTIPGGGVRMLRLDDFALRGVDLLKIDVEGFEGAVVQGAIDTLAECKPVVVFEDNGLGPKLYGDAWVDPKPVLADLSYRCRKRIAKDEIWTCA